MKLYSRFILFLLIVTLTACKKEITQPEQISFDNSYYPLIIGSWVSYQIEDINIDNEVNLNDTLNYQIKEIVESIGEQSETYIDYRIERQYRKTSDNAWALLDVWQVRQLAKRIHKIEENIEYIKLVTPVTLRDKWNGNAFNSLKEENYEVSDITDTLFLNKNLSKATIEHINESSLVAKNYSTEEYIEGIGLINKIDIDVILNIDPNIDWQDKVIKGRIYSQKYMESSQYSTSN